MSLDYATHLAAHVLNDEKIVSRFTVDTARYLTNGDCTR